MRLRSRKNAEAGAAVVEKKSVIGGRHHLQRTAKDKVYAEGLLKVTARQALVSRMKGRVYDVVSYTV